MRINDRDLADIVADGRDGRLVSVSQRTTMDAMRDLAEARDAIRSLHDLAAKERERCATIAEAQIGRFRGKIRAINDATARTIAAEIRKGPRLDGDPENPMARVESSRPGR